MAVYQVLGFESEGGTIAPPRDILRRHIVKPEPVIFDVGASAGQSVERFRALFPDAIIHAFEPQFDVFMTLSERFGGRPGIVLNCMALGDHTGAATLHRNNFNVTSSILPVDQSSPWVQSLDIQEIGAVGVRMGTIDEYCAERGIASIDLLKLDVQGFEPECLQGAATMLAERRIGIIQLEIILHPMYARPTSFATIETLLAPHGYRLYTIFDIGMDEAGELMQLDALYLPR